jgi:hypothetical protein
LLLAGTVGFALLGQVYFFWRREYVWDGIIFYGLALVCLARLLRARSRRYAPPARTSLPLARRDDRHWLSAHWRTILAGLALLLNLIAARSANAYPPPADYTFCVLLWLVSLALFGAAWLLPLHIKGTPAFTWRYRYATELAPVLGLLLVGLLLRAWDLKNIPANLSGDEGTQGLWAVEALEGRLGNPFATGWFTVPTMSFFAQAASLRLCGDSVAGLRALSALTGTATLLCTYLLARRSLGRRVALFALAILTFNHYHIHFSRLGSNQVADPFFMTLTLWLLTEGFRRASSDARPRTSPWFLAAGLTMGLSWYGYFGSRVIVLVVAVYVGTRMKREFLRRHARELVLMALIALMAASPLLLHYAKRPENLSARFNQVNFFRWLQNELARPDHDSTWKLVLRQVWLSISAFNHTLDPTFWYRAQIPLLDFVSGIFFILGLAVAASQWRRPAVRLILVWFGLALTLGWVLTENPPSSMRMVIIAPAVALLAALGLDRLLALARWALGERKTQLNDVALALLVVVATLNVHYYFVVYTPRRVYGNPSAETATTLARYLARRDDEPFVYFYGPPFLYYEFGAISFIARDVSGTNVPPRDQDPGYLTHVRGPTLFVVLGERQDELAAIQARHPNGRLQEFYSMVNRRLMFVVYEVLR